MQSQNQMNQFNQSNQVPAQNDMLVQDKAPKQKNKYVPVIAILTIVAIAGLGFGGYELWQNMQKDEEVKTLQAENIDLQVEKNEAEAKVAEGGTTLETRGITESDAASEVKENTSDYMYVGEWGIKIKKPEDAKNKIREYSFYNGFPQAADTFTVSEISESNIADVLISNGTGYDCNYWMQAPTACFDINDVRIVIHASEYVSQDFKAFFTNPENYSKIK